jgi:prepilin-type processing-associated H-X9-DG protein
MFLVPWYKALRIQGEQSICTNNLRQLGQSVLMYASDYDDTLPLTQYNNNGVWMTNFQANVPSNWSSMIEHPLTIGSKYIWPNSTVSYGGSFETMKCPSVSVQKLQIARFTYDNPVVPPVPVSYVINGLTHSYKLSDITNPKLVPLLWEQTGKTAILGGARQSPLLNCAQMASNGLTECKYHRPRDLQDFFIGGFGTVGSIWVHGRNCNFLYVDGHVEAKPLGQQTGKSWSDEVPTDPTIDPFTIYNDRGIPNFYNTPPASSGYPSNMPGYLFAPDRT